MRHGSGDQTDDYSLARLSEMSDAIKRLRFPDEKASETRRKTGTTDAGPLVTDWSQAVPAPALTGTQTGATGGDGIVGSSLKNQSVTPLWHAVALTGLRIAPNPDTVEKSRPRSSVG